MKQIILITAAFYGMSAVILGALGAHAFKKILAVEKLVSFETGVRYQMYHAIVLLIIGWIFSFTTSLERWSGICLILGTFLFSVSIYFLAFADYWKMNLYFLGPVTPLGGVFMIIGWFCMLLVFFKENIVK